MVTTLFKETHLS